MNKKFIVILVLGLLVSASPVLAVTTDEIKAQITALQSQITQLITQLNKLQGNSDATWCHTFNTNLGVGSSGVEVDALHTALAKDGFGNDNWQHNNFDEATASLVVEFQEKYASEILKPLNLKRGTGYMGPSTQAKLNILYGCDNQLINCTKEGMTYFLSLAHRGSCCAGLTAISPDYAYDSACNIIASQQHIKVCTHCGNGVCSNDENQCNCPQDCKKKSMTVIYPNGGETLYFGSTYTIKWKSWGVEKAVIYLWFSDGGTCLLGSVPASQGSYTFKPEENKGCPNIAKGLTSGQYKVYIVTEDADLGVGGTGAQDSSDNFFSIVSQMQKTCTDSDDGKNYYVKGAAKNSSGTQRTDVCQINLSSNTATGVLFEAICDSNNAANYSSYTCPNGCSDGVCKIQSVEKSITVVSPNGGEQFKAGQAYQIEWLAPFASRISIDILDQDGKAITTGLPAVIANIAGSSNYVSSNSMQWFVPAGTFGGQYRVKACNCPSTISYLACANSDLSSYGCDLSDDYFSISSNPIILSPNGGESLMNGGSAVIKWSALSLPSSVLVTLNLIDYTSAVPKSIIIDAVPNSGSYFWAIPNKIINDSGETVLSGSKYKVQIITKFPGSTVLEKDESDDYFSISNSLSQTNLRVKSIGRKTSSPYNFYANVCVDGPKSINNLKAQDKRITSFPVAHIINGGTNYPMVSGSIENLKNGECMQYEFNLGVSDEASLNNKTLTYILDPKNLISESNETDNQFIYTILNR